MTIAEQAAGAGLKSVLVAYDFTDASHKPFRHALSIARHFGAKLYAVYVLSSIGYEIAGPEASHLAYDGAVRDVQRKWQEFQDSGAATGVDCKFLVREGNVWDELKAVIQEEKIDAVVAGTHARGGFGKFLLGSVAEQIFRQADCLVLTVGPGSREDSLIERKGIVRPFLFATDFGEASLSALPYAALFARHFNTKLVVLHVLPAVPATGTFHWSTTGDPEEVRRQAQLASQNLFERLVTARIPSGTNLEFMVRFGIVTEQILQTCQEVNVDLLILGLNASKHADSASHWPWATAHELVSTATCPVLTWKHTPGL
jgi:nucleotide-binding universal stress UspA family protein